MKKVLFVCVENSCRSQMADGFAKVFGQGQIESYSAGSRPSSKVNPDAITVMQEAGVDISTARTKGFSDLPVKQFDYLITMGCQDTCPFVPAKEHIDWQITDPKGKDLDFFRKTRDEIREKVINFIEKEA